MTVDRFGNPHAPNLSYARGKISIRADGLIPGDWPHRTGTAARQENEDASVGTAASKRGTNGSNPAPSRGESVANFLFLAQALPLDLGLQNHRVQLSAPLPYGASVLLLKVSAGVVENWKRGQR